MIFLWRRNCVLFFIIDCSKFAYIKFYDDQMIFSFDKICESNLKIHLFSYLGPWLGFYLKLPFFFSTESYSYAIT